MKQKKTGVSQNNDLRHARFYRMRNRFAFPYIKFDQVLLTDITKQAYVEPVIFYNRYGNLQSYLEEFPVGWALLQVEPSPRYDVIVLPVRRSGCCAGTGLRVDVSQMGSIGVLKNAKRLHFVLCRSCFCY